MGGLSACSHRTPYFREGLPSFGADGAAQPLRSRVILVGDAGEVDAVVLEQVEQWAGMDPSATLVAFLGDNMYPEGMTRRRLHEAEARLLPQIQAAERSGARVVFIPGNHDWAEGGEEGFEAVLEQERYVHARLGYAGGFLPQNGCPGPAVADLFDGVRIVALDTQWWLHAGPKPTTECPEGTSEEVLAALGRLLDTDRHVVVLAHHPLFGYGRHAGFSEWREHLLPPIIGSVIALSRKLPLRSQDHNSARYKAMVAAFEGVFRDRPEREGLLVWASGHEHNLQVLEGESVDYVLISGSGAKTTPVNDGDETLFAHSRPGFMALDVLTTGAAILRVIEPDGGAVFTLRLEE